MQTLEIDRKKWARGNKGKNFSCLFDSETGKYCVLGFFGKKFFDLEDIEMNRRAFISDILFDLKAGEKSTEIEQRIENFINKFCPNNKIESGAMHKIVSTNDNSFEEDKARELNLTRLFRKHFNIELEFTG